MSALVVVFVGLAAGIAARRVAALPDDAPRVINIWLLDIALPALTLHVLHGVEFPSQVLLIVGAPYLLFAVTVLIYLVAGRLLRLRREVLVALIATTAVANTSFVGIPMVTAFFGESWVPVALLADQLGSYLLLNTAVLTLVTATAGAARPGRALDLGSLLPDSRASYSWTPGVPVGRTGGRTAPTPRRPAPSRRRRDRSTDER